MADAEPVVASGPRRKDKPARDDGKRAAGHFARQGLDGSSPQDNANEYFFAWWATVAGPAAPEPDFARMTVRQVLEFGTFLHDAVYRRVGPAVPGSVHVLTAFLRDDLETIVCVLRRNHTMFVVRVREPQRGQKELECPRNMQAHELQELYSIMKPTLAMVSPCLGCSWPGVRTSRWPELDGVPLALERCATCGQWLLHARCARKVKCPACALGPRAESTEDLA